VLDNNCWIVAAVIIDKPFLLSGTFYKTVYQKILFNKNMNHRKPVNNKESAA
jgi:hypothetical protein